MQGKILKGIGGFYYVHAEDGEIYECRARGIFRKNREKPLPGDNAEFTVTHEGDKEGNLISILPRKNVLIRPAVANVDQALIVFAVKSPDPNLNLLDRFLIYMSEQHIPVSIYFNKEDLCTPDECRRLCEIYEAAGYKVIAGSVGDKATEQRIKELLKGVTTVLSGPSGVGKSSLINRLLGEEKMITGELSEKIQRGKQTTRHSEIFSLKCGGYILDTPGFTSLNLNELRLPDLKSDELRYSYEEFSEYYPKCRYNTCSHVFEPEAACAVKRAVTEGRIAKERYDNYVQIYTELRESEKQY